MIFKLALLGGLYAVLTFIHAASDFLLQSHAEAMVKHNHPKIRAKHCLIYAVSFIPLFCFCSFSLIEWIIALNVLFWSHFYLDTYHFVFVWAKYIRRPPEMTLPIQQTNADGYVNVLPPDPKKGFVEFVSTPLGKILMIAVDQITHLAFLFPIAYLILRHI